MSASIAGLSAAAFVLVAASSLHRDPWRSLPARSSSLHGLSWSRLVRSFVRALSSLIGGRL